MRKIYKLTLLLALLALASAGLSFLTDYQAGWQVGMVFLLPILWALWFACIASFKPGTGVWKLILLWMLIDITVLSVNRLMMGSFHGIDPKGGSELVWLIEFSPPILPMMLANLLPIIGTCQDAIVNGASHLLLPVGYGGVLKDWLDGSILSAISSSLFAGLWLHRKSSCKSKPATE